MGVKATVITPTNRPNGYKYALHALREQTMPQEDWELIIVDDYLKDRAQILEEAEELGLENVRVFESKPNYWRSNRLIANARNTALIYAEGELIVFLDDYCWVRPKWLEEHWRTYRRGPYTMVGAMRAVKYVPGRYHRMDLVPPPEPGENYWEERERLRTWEPKEQKERTREVGHFWVTDSRGRRPKRDCGGGWFYCCNASAPLEKIVEVNGFDEEFDLTSEEDIDLGLRLERVGCRFWYRPDYECTVFHVDHRWVDSGARAKKYREVSYEELRRRGVLESEPDEVQLVLKEKYGTQYDGSWGLLERNRKRGPVANIVNGVKIFDLREERRRVRRE